MRRRAPGTHRSARRGVALLVMLIFTFVIGVWVVLLVNNASSLARPAIAQRQIVQTDLAVASAISRTLDAWPVAWRYVPPGALVVDTTFKDASGAGGSSLLRDTTRVRITRRGDGAYAFEVSSIFGPSRRARSFAGVRLFYGARIPSVILAVGPSRFDPGSVLTVTDSAGVGAPLRCSPSGGFPAPPLTYGVTVPSLTALPDLLTSVTYHGPPAQRVGLVSGLNAAAVLTSTSGLTAADLLRQATQVVGPGTVIERGAGGVFANTLPNEMPILYATGSLTLRGASPLWGLVIADGPVRVEGTFEGVIVNRAGGVEVATGGVVRGQILAADSLVGVTVRGGGRVSASSCAADAINYGRVLGRPLVNYRLTNLVGLNT